MHCTSRPMMGTNLGSESMYISEVDFCDTCKDIQWLGGRLTFLGSLRLFNSRPFGRSCLMPMATEGSSGQDNVLYNKSLPYVVNYVRTYKGS